MLCSEAATRLLWYRSTSKSSEEWKEREAPANINESQTSCNCRGVRRPGRRYSRSVAKLNLAVSVLTVRPEEQLFLVQDRSLNTFLLWAIFALLFGRCLSPMKAQVLPLRLPQEVRQESQTVSRNHLQQSTAPPNVSFTYCFRKTAFDCLRFFNHAFYDTWIRSDKLRKVE